MKRMNLIVLKDGEEEAGERRHKAGKEGVHKERILRDGKIIGPRRARPQGGGPPLVRLGGRHVAHLVYRLLVGDARPLQRALRSSRLCRLHRGLFASPRGRPVLPRGGASLARHCWRRKIWRRKVWRCVIGRSAESAKKKMEQWKGMRLK